MGTRAWERIPHGVEIWKFFPTIFLQKFRQSNFVIKELPTYMYLL